MPRPFLWYTWVPAGNSPRGGGGGGVGTTAMVVTVLVLGSIGGLTFVAVSDLVSFGRRTLR